MSKNRGDRITLLQKVVGKHFTPVLAPKDRTVLEHIVYASCLEDAGYDVADEAFHRLQEFFVDWNEVRVTTVSELIEYLHKLPDPGAAAVRVKKNLQSIFETRYSFDIEDLVKMNQGKAIAELEKLSGMSPFVLNYIIQNALGGHAIPVSKSIIEVLVAVEVITDAEAAKGQVPGLERTIPKSKGGEFASCLHQLGLLVASAPNGKNTKAILKEAGAPDKKDKVKEAPAPKPVSKAKAPPANTKPKAEVPKKLEAPKKPAPKKALPAKKAAEKPAKKAPPTKKPNTKGGAPTKRKPK
jgi:hypothetical protein